MSCLPSTLRSRGMATQVCGATMGCLTSHASLPTGVCVFSLVRACRCCCDRVMAWMTSWMGTEHVSRAAVHRSASVTKVCNSAREGLSGLGTRLLSMPCDQEKGACMQWLEALCSCLFDQSKVGHVAADQHADRLCKGVPCACVSIPCSLPVAHRASGRMWQRTSCRETTCAMPQEPCPRVHCQPKEAAAPSAPPTACLVSARCLPRQLAVCAGDDVHSQLLWAAMQTLAAL